MDDICPTMDWFTVTRSCINLLEFYLIWVLETSDSVQGQIICKWIGFFGDRTVKKENKCINMMLNGKKVLEWNENLGVVNNNKITNKQN